MDINFPLILFLLVAFGTVIWIADIVFLRKRRDPDQADPFLVENAKQLTPILALVFVIRSFLFEPFQIPSASMENTLLTGDFILVNKFAYGIRLPILRNKVADINLPERGDVMVFFPPHDDRYFIKRVIGLPGDRVEYRNKVLFINGVEQKQEPFENTEKRSLYRQYWEDRGDQRHQIQVNLANRTPKTINYVVPDGMYFMMGDNRDNSQDSRVWGPVPEERIVGKAVAVWMHKKPGWNLPTFKDVRSIR